MKSIDLDTLQLTGRTGFRQGWFGRLIMTVEAQKIISCYPAAPPPPGTPAKTLLHWRDATLLDMFKIQQIESEQAQAIKPPPVKP